MADEARDYVGLAHQYAADILDGTIPACKWVKAACQRHVDDLARQGTEDFPYVFDPNKAVRVCWHVELQHHIKGEWASRGEQFVLHPSQCFRLAVIFGWVHMDTGYRRFRQVYDEEARKNGKSALASAVANYMFTDDGEEGAEIYSCATTRDQASIIFAGSRAMARKSPGYSNHYGINIQMRALTIDQTNSTYRALSADAHTLDGLNPHFTSLDEIHAMKQRALYDVIESAMGSRSQSMIYGVTTAGFDRAGICFELHTYTKRILNTTLHANDGLGYKVEGTSAVDETFFGIIYTLDDDDDWTDEDVWIKANPLLDVSVKRDDIRRMCRKAQEMPSAQNNFLTKRMNLWVNTATAFFDMRLYDQCADLGMLKDDFEGETCMTGSDLASRWDLAVDAQVFRREIDGEFHYFSFERHYLPEESIEASGNSQYDGWVRQGHITATSGNIIDFDVIMDNLREDSTMFDLHQTGFDPHQATLVITTLLKEGFDVVEVAPVVANFSEPLKEFEALVRAGRWHHTGNPVTAWNIANCEVQPDRKDNIYPRKATEGAKIDGVIAILIALNLWMRYGGKAGSVYDTRGLRSL